MTSNILEKYNLNFSFLSTEQFKEWSFSKTDQNLSSNNFSIDFQNLMKIEYEEMNVLILKFTDGVLRIDLPFDDMQFLFETFGVKKYNTEA